MKKVVLLILVSCIIIGICLFNVLENYFTYKEIMSAVQTAKEKVLNINNVKIQVEPTLANKEYDKVTIVIKDSVQCNTDDRDYSENNNTEYVILDLNKNEKYEIVSHYEDKKIYIGSAENERLFTVQSLELLTVPNFSLFGYYNYDMSIGQINQEECYKIDIYNKKIDAYEYSYWISKDTGLLLKEEKYVTDGEINNLQCVQYNYFFDVVTDEEVKMIDLQNYSEYEIIDNR